MQVLECSGGWEAHEAHMALNNECPWEHQADARASIRAAAAEATEDGRAATMSCAASLVRPDREQHLLHTNARKDLTAKLTARALGKPEPATPHLDELTRRQAMETPKAKTTKSPTVELWVRRGDGPVSSVPKPLSKIAYFYTDGIKAGKPRITPDELRAIMVKLGADFDKPGWTVTLPTDLTIIAVVPGSGQPKVKGAAKAVESPKTPEGKSASGEAVKAAATKKAPAKKAAAKKATDDAGRAQEGKTRAKKAAAKRTAPTMKAGKEVTPNFKNGNAPAKKAPAKKAATTEPGPKSLAALLP